ncbi:MAG: Ig-like domain-containing protein, partial [Actinomycetota bacterium]
VGFSKEPTGLGYMAPTNTLLISDDSKHYVWLEQAGSDGKFGTTDDTRTFINAGAYGSTDTEDPEYLNGHIYFLDGKGTEIYNIGPGNDGKFGTSDDTMSHFDIGYLATDWEGLSSNPVTGDLLAGARATKKIYELTPTGTLVQTIDASKITGMKYLSGLAYAPASNGNGWDYWIVDRAVDNNQVASENDGKLWEVTTSQATTDNPPSVSITSPKSGDTVSGTTAVSANASDDHGVSQVQFFDGATSIGTDTNGGDGWSVSWDTTAAADGSHTLTAKATDTANQSTTSAGVAVTVSNTATDNPPSVSITSPKTGDKVRGTVNVTASASDDHGVTQVQFLDGGTPIATDTNGSDGWSASWDTTGGTGDGSHTLTAIATDTTSQTTTSAGQTVTVDNTAPSVSITSPADATTVSGTVSVIANADDAGGTGVASVQFFNDGVAIGTDTNGSDGWSVSWNTGGTSNASHTLTATATDAAGNQTTSAGIGVTVSNTGTTGSIDNKIAAYTDDVEQFADGTVGKSSADLDMMNDGTTVQAAVGLRFTNVAIPQGATITDAWVQFWPNEKRSDATTLYVQADASDNSAAMSTKNPLTTRTLTSAKVTWVPPAWTTLDVPGPEAQTPDIASVVQEIVSRGGWVSGNALGIIITGSGRRVAEAYDANPSWAPLLHVDYTVP